MRRRPESGPVLGTCYISAAQRMFKDGKRTSMSKEIS